MLHRIKPVHYIILLVALSLIVVSRNVSKADVHQFMDRYVLGAECVHTVDVGEPEGYWTPMLMEHGQFHLGNCRMYDGRIIPMKWTQRQVIFEHAEWKR